MTSFDTHPIFVHFPIALLTVYSLLEIVRLRVITKQSWYLPIKTILLVIGVAGAGAALLTGDIAAEAFQKTSTKALVELHSMYAYGATIVYGLLTLSHLIRIGNVSHAARLLPAGMQNVWASLCKMELRLFSAPVLIIGAIAGLLLISIVGALGGALVYGPDVDPVVSVIYHLLYKP